MKNTAKAMTLILLCFLAFLAANVQSAHAITINSDGTITGTDKIRQEGNVYTLTDNIIYTIRVGKSNVVIDGAGYTLEGNEIEGNGAGLLLLPGADRVTIKNLKITNFVTGIRLKGTGNLVTDCTISDCSAGIDLNEAEDNTISDNRLIDTDAGIAISYSSNNIFRDNKLENSTLFFDEGWLNSIDTSNNIDGKPIYYLVNKKNLTISPADYPNIGYLALVNCTNMTVRNLRLSGITFSLVSTTNSMIIHNSLTNSWHGLQIRDSYGNVITENYVAHNKEFGILISSTLANTITGNIIENNNVGVYLVGSSQIIFHNNFINNSMHADSADWNPLNFLPLPNGMHVWDNGYPSGGNYWSSLNPTDANSDGIGDTAYVINQLRNNTDRYPLTNPVVIPEMPNGSSEAEPFPTTLFISSAIAVTVVGLGLLVYLKKRHPKTGDRSP